MYFKEIKFMNLRTSLSLAVGFFLKYNRKFWKKYLKIINLEAKQIFKRRMLNI